MSSSKRKSCKDLNEASALALMRAIVVPLAKNCKLQGLAERGQRALSLINQARLRKARASTSPRLAVCESMAARI